MRLRTLDARRLGRVGLASVVFRLVVALALGLALVLIRRDGSPQAIALAGVAPRDLECYQMKLLEPEGGPRVSADEARHTAAEVGDPLGLPVRQVVLARLVQEGRESNLRDNLVWAVVSSDGKVHEFSGPSGPGTEAGAVRKPTAVTYALAFVDAITGEFIFGQYGPPSPEYTCP